jgi:sugar phosphate isomerase/epimerase
VTASVPSGFGADAVGICPGTLLVDPAYDAANVELSLRAAAGAGFTSVSLWSMWATRYGLDATRGLLDDLGLAVPSLEAATSWSNGPAAAEADADLHLEVAAALGAGVLQAVELAPAFDSFSRAVDGFTALCERARAHDVAIAIEFVPWTAIPDLATAWRIVRESGASNGGICVDFLHWQRQPGGPDFDVLREIPGECISYVQACDAGPAAPNSFAGYMSDAMRARPLPGDGIVDIDRLLDALAEIGAEPYVAFEPFNTELARTGADVMAAQVLARTARFA